MINGAGKYDDALTLAKESVGANQGILIILDGKNGHGFSVQATKNVINQIPEILENMAKQIRADNQQ